ncbi:hypothetical protein AKUH3B204M_03120 [Apilactobacillus kunkeei]|uniref:hypothetical protein n=1 Tax=Apilactobacillus kunkeei TaxID=148814 RepID=UPI0013629C79|nr:hypothetical protein [Apilactobacillus kunkeei]MBI0091930.1 hypothetical protein [Lactobacillus sp. M0345]NBI01048.1 hypothetical protein [Apilactobacillus kunkeei]CAI2568901.1 hypothetical protein AKUA1802_03080 [Apilactobacillus kunkeei]CAI2569487.1 hypothetical protein AKUH3B203M01_13020 [Apilactobacillus kunkeei]CAI2569504.1 hypothetical protein AKUA0901_03080 [Apilactobacillus kunkeei]
MQSKNQYVYSLLSTATSSNEAKISHPRMNVTIDTHTRIVVNPCFNDYLIVQNLIAGYTEMTDINRAISKEFTFCEPSSVHHITFSEFR